MHPIEVLGTYWQQFLTGAGITVALTGLSAILAAVIAPLLALVRVGGNRWAQWPLRLYISFMRGTPLLAQLFLVYYGAGQFRPTLEAWGLWSFFRDPFNCALLVFAVNSTAYQTEILRGGIQGVPPGEVEAARAVGMNRVQTLRRVVFPHAYRIAWPALGNEIILLMKASAIASVVTVFDIMGRTRQIFAKTFDFSAYLWAALLYLALTAIFIALWRLAEARLSRHIGARERGVGTEAVTRGAGA
jgi:polar amino acid transport system permease protein